MLKMILTYSPMIIDRKGLQKYCDETIPDVAESRHKISKALIKGVGRNVSGKSVLKKETQ